MFTDIKALVVDDVNSFRRVLVILLKQLGIEEVDEVDSGQACLEKLGSSSYQLILCDFHLGDMDALQILAKIKEDEKHRSIPFLLITGDVDTSEAEKAKEQGASGFLFKPFGLEQLRAKLEEIIP